MCHTRIPVYYWTKKSEAFVQKKSSQTFFPVAPSFSDAVSYCVCLVDPRDLFQQAIIGLRPPRVYTSQWEYNNSGSANVFVFLTFFI